MAIECVLPSERKATPLPDSSATCSGIKEFVYFPCPSLKYKPHPHVNNSSSQSMAPLFFSPQNIFLITLLFS